MKKIQQIMALAVLLSAVSFGTPVCAQPVDVTVNGQAVAFPDVQPYVDARSQRTLVPVRFVAEKLGLRTQWDAKTGQVTLQNATTTIRLTVGQSIAHVNGKQVQLDTTAALRNGRTMVPLRFISESFDARIDWNAERNLIVIATAAPKQHSTWLWDASLLLSGQEQERTIEFAVEQQVTSIYLQIDKDISQAVYQSFMQKAQQRQIKVEALNGRPGWAFPSGHSQIEAFIDWVEAYNAAVAPEERFSGLHFDIEPYVLPEWKSDQTRVVSNWMDSIRLIERRTKANGLRLTLDIPFWLHQVKVPDTRYSLSAWMLEKADAVVIMDYRNSALGNDGIIANAQPILREAGTLGKQVIVGIETAPSAEGAHTTFHSLPTHVLKTELQLAKEKLAQHASYAGFAIHDYNHWTKLKQDSF
ncbi:copper amine oxidase N-terminal domain-containing protein [Brevibacillus parabrevis]|uniref:copper amine oxidase N-terminal domain-containing protein n=1 Tax=Brevibacillus parabrevis TaxID=54914 RepID=UPI0023800108|nr:copper amine oxidase N-terminal domain-containing protein [Brevibacillus parabrevis]WDV96530.1 copper amine oxidase N-terminal domain-containing protein [Brevibacillus parabrevis]